MRQEVTINSRERWLPLAVFLLLFFSTVLLFWPTLGLPFLSYDDPDYVTQNDAVQAGLTVQTLRWAFSAGHAANWHPLTWLSHALDCQLFGLAPAGHHLTSVLLHATSTGLLFLILRRWLGSVALSACLAAFFAWHPLRVESVAWVAERKDVLSGLCFLATLWAYTRYAEGRIRRGPWHWYALALLFFALGLMSKPMLVTLPFLLLLLDFWPFKRWTTDSGRKFGSNAIPLVVEKIPFLALSILSSVVTYLVQAGAYAVKDASIGERIARAVCNYPGYLEKFLFPYPLAIFYPQEPVGFASLAAAALLLAGITLTTLVLVRRRPELSVGWFWFAGMLVPVIGLVQVGAQSIADRYTYLPSIGLSLALLFGVVQLQNSFKIGKWLGPVAAALVLGAMVFLTRAYLAHWKTSEALFRHSLAVTGPNPVALNHLGEVLLCENRIEEAKPLFVAALDLNPGYSPALFNHSKIMILQGNAAGAYRLLQPSLQGKPVQPLQYALVAAAFANAGEDGFAIDFYRKALEANLDFVDALNNLCWLLATNPHDDLRNGPEAVRLGERACALTGYSRPMFLGTLAAAYAEAGRFSDAKAMALRAIESARASGDTAVAERNTQLLNIYSTGKAWHEITAPRQPLDRQTP